ncbi:hypothetical protein AXK11_07815 [Cephaloticoccus primus]|uniref:Prepilin-type N-terminal cleavage/methylation domain-containing protein n=1 Tax=Cephaloticoccus primus TaxID=1548207 RepID=A0A139SJS9_9BACT|nr:hypothetical protein [Cephaloticoccus primus]KXU34740.1 hypothetical protein AXK11_07815 [Cephaloticoccus primus]
MSTQVTEPKPFSLIEILIVLIVIGLMTAMALPVFAMVRNSALEKGVLENLRRLDAAAQQYYLEHGVSSAPYEALVGPDKYIEQLTPVAGEDYSKLSFDADLAELSITAPKVKKGKVITLRRSGQ